MAIPEESFDENFGGIRWEDDVGGIESLKRGMRAGNDWYGPGRGNG